MAGLKRELAALLLAMQERLHSLEAVQEQQNAAIAVGPPRPQLTIASNCCSMLKWSFVVMPARDLELAALCLIHADGLTYFTKMHQLWVLGRSMRPGFMQTTVMPAWPLLCPPYTSLKALDSEALYAAGPHARPVCLNRPER